MAGLCISLAGGALGAVLLGDVFTLTWTHSVERIAWQERYRIAGQELILEEARVKGSGAGMDPRAGARLENGAWTYRPELPPLPEAILAASRFTAGHGICVAGTCHALRDLVPEDSEEQPIVLRACAADG